VAGALSVGIGFGLQNVVNNFVSGIILLFERPIRIGDRITLGTTSGQVRRIGFRSSTIATADGAEVVVPNGTLLSERVINWTLSNDQRCIEITVGVACGNDPTAVIGVLEGAVKDVSALLGEPAPRTRHGLRRQQPPVHPRGVDRPSGHLRVRAQPGSHRSTRCAPRRENRDPAFEAGARTGTQRRGALMRRRKALHSMRPREPPRGEDLA
jgi:small-conductance mechanosensitive channel